MSLFASDFLSDRFVSCLVVAAMAVCGISAGALLLAKFFSRRPPIQHVVLGSALVCCLLAPVLTLALRSFGISTFSFLVTAEQNDVNADLGEFEPDASIASFLDSLLGKGARANHPQSREAASPSPTTIVTGNTANPAPNQTSPSSIAATANDDPSDSAIRRSLTIIPVIWLIGSAMLLIGIVASSLRVAWIRHRSKPSRAATACINCLTEVKRRLGRRWLPPILESGKIQSPIAAGVFRPAVILPAGFTTKITDSQLSDVLTHECAHIFRCDPLILYLQVIAGSLFWPIPLVHWLNRKLSSVREEICDNYVLDERDPLQYAETLMKIATMGFRPQWLRATVGMLHWRGTLETRIEGLIDPRRSKLTRASQLGAGLCLAGMLVVTAATCGISIGKARAEVQPVEAPSGPDAAAPADATAPKELDPPTNLPANERKIIQIWWGIQGPLGEEFIKQVDRFNLSQQRIVVETVMLNGYKGVYEELKKGFRSGDLPAAAIVEIHSVPTLAAGGQIKPLDGLIKADAKFQPEDLLPGILTNLRHDEKLVALPINRSTPILYYNKDRFSAAGLDPEKPPKTWQELRQMSKALTANDQNQYGFLAVNFPWTFESLVWSSGGKLVDGNRPVFAESGSKPLQLWADMVHRDQTARFGTRRSETAEFTQGRAAMVIESTAMLRWYSDAAYFQVGTAPLPHWEGCAGAVPTGGGAAVIPAALPPEKQAAAWEFLSWFISTQQTADLSRATGYLPVRESARVLLRTEDFYKEHPEYETAIEQLKTAREAPQLPRWHESWPIIGEAMKAVLVDDAPADEKLKSAEAAVQLLLNEKAD